MTTDGLVLGTLDRLAEALSRPVSEYDYVSRLRGAELAWEFLRRCDEYRSDYSRYIELKSKAEQASPRWVSDNLWGDVNDMKDALCEKWIIYKSAPLVNASDDTPPEFKIYPHAISPVIIGECIDSVKNDYTRDLVTSSDTVWLAVHFRRDIDVQLDSTDISQMGGPSAPD